MNITFSGDTPRFSRTHLTVLFSASVDGRPVDCAISVEALEDHFGVDSISAASWIKAFCDHRDRIEQVAREHLLSGSDTPVLLKSGHFHPLAMRQQIHSAALLRV